MLWLLFSFLFFHKYQPAMQAQDINFVFISESFSSMGQVNKFFRYHWNTSSIPYGDFIYIYIAGGHFDKLYISDSAFVNYPVNMIYKKKDTLYFPLNYYKGALLLFYNDTKPNLLDVWQKKEYFQTVLSTKPKHFSSLKFYYRNKTIPVFVVRQPTDTRIYKFVNYSKDITFIKTLKRIFMLHRNKQRLNFWVIKLLSHNAIGTKGLFTKGQKPIFEQIKAPYLFDGFYFTIDSLSTAVSIADSAMVEYTDMDTLAILKMYYATDSNFAGKIFYPCPRCLLRYSVAKALLKASLEFAKKKYRLVLFDCYRPFQVQKQMWKAFPNKLYLASPSHGSMHNRGMAVDISLADWQGHLLNMGTDFDYFGIAAHTDYIYLSAKQKNNRTILRKIMHKYGFAPITTEWWHYSYRKPPIYPILNFWWNCQ